MTRTRLILFAALLLAGCGVAIAAPTVFPLNRQSSSAQTFTSTVGIGDTLTLTKTGATNKVVSDTTATAMTSSVGAITLEPSANPAANDLVVEINDESAVSLWSVDNEGDTLQLGDATLAGNDLTCSGTGASCQLNSGANDSTTSTTVGAFTVKPSVNVSDGDLVVDIQNSAADHLFTVNEQGLCTSLTKLVATTDIDLAGNDITGTGTTQSLNIVGNTADGTTSGTVSSITLKAGADIASADLVLAVRDAAATALMTITEAGTTLVLGVLTATGGITSTGTLTATARIVASVQAITVADSGNGSAAADTLTPAAAYVRYTCSDADTCAITLSETGALDGAAFTVTNVSANAITFADTAGLTETGGALSLGQYDSVTFIYASDRFIQVSAVENN